MKHYSIIQRNKSRGDLTWYGRTYDSGIVRYQSLKTKSKMVAKQWLDLMNSSRFLPENYFQKFEKKDKLLLEAIHKYMEHFSTQANNLSYATYNSKMNVFKRFCDSKNIKYLRDITKDIALQFNASLTSLATATHRDTLKFVIRFQKFCNQVFEMEDWQPFSIIKLPKLIKRSKSFWTLEELALILDAAPNKHYRLLWALMAYAGLRYSEALNINPMSFVGGRIRIVGKGSKEAFIPISNKLKTEIERFGNITEIDFNANIMSSKASNAKKLRKAVADAKINNTGEITNHRFRHSFASNLLRNSVSIKAVQQLMRHESAELTLNTYSHLLQDDLTEAANAF